MITNMGIDNGNVIPSGNTLFDDSLRQRVKDSIEKSVDGMPTKMNTNQK